MPPSNGRVGRVHTHLGSQMVPGLLANTVFSVLSLGCAEVTGFFGYDFCLQSVSHELGYQVKVLDDIAS